MLDKPWSVLITGGSGFLGRNLVTTLLDKHPTWRITILDLSPPPEHLRNRIDRFIEADVGSSDSVAQAFQQSAFDLVVHSAGIVPARRKRYSTRKDDWERCKYVNYRGTVNVLNAAMAAGCHKFVYTSSTTVVIDQFLVDYPYATEDATPVDKATLHYGKSKGMAEQYVLSPKHAKEGLSACALRPCTILGPGDTAVMSVFHDLIAKGETYFIIGDGNNLYDWMYIDNAVHAHVLAVENLLTTQTAAGHAFFVTNDEPVYFWDSLAFIWAQFGHVPERRIRIPTTVAWLVALLMEIVTLLTGAPTTLDTGSVQDAVRTQYHSNEKARRILGYVPLVGLSEGLRRSCEDYKQVLAAKAVNHLVVDGD